jgi:3-methyl-2-oxobutanoate hydroxymethyltransferase
MDQKITLPVLRRKKEQNEKIVTVTCYDYPSALLLDRAGVDIVFVGDSLGDNVLGYDTTLYVTLDEMVHHTKAVRRGVTRALLMADLPFLTYQVSPEDALRNAGRLLREAGVEAVKLEGGESVAPTVERLVSAGIPVMGHLGLTPQSVHQLGGYRIQGRTPEEANRLLADAKRLESAGAFAIVLEMIPDELGRSVSESLAIPTIGIGAGPYCDGQVQVFHDLFGLYPDRRFKHNRRYAEVGQTILDAAREFVCEVRNGQFPPSSAA